MSAEGRSILNQARSADAGGHLTAGQFTAAIEAAEREYSYEAQPPCENPRAVEAAVGGSTYAMRCGTCPACHEAGVVDETHIWDEETLDRRLAGVRYLIMAARGELSDPDRKPEADPPTSCDWGRCRNPSTGWRWWEDRGGWLPVCDVHTEEERHTVPRLTTSRAGRHA